MNNIIQKITSKFEKNGSKKNLENLIVFVIILIVTIIFINYIWNNNSDQKEENILNNNEQELVQTTEVISTQTTNEYTLAKQIENILKKLEGVGNVSVLITYNESKQIQPIYNEDTQISTTQEEDNQGGTRTINENSTKKEVVYQESNGEKSIITSKIISPEIKGAVIIAEGANNINVKNNIIQVVEAATGLPTHKIQVFKMK